MKDEICLILVSGKGIATVTIWPFLMISPQFFFEWEMMATKVVEELKTHFCIQ